MYPMMHMMNLKSVGAVALGAALLFGGASIANAQMSTTPGVGSGTSPSTGTVGTPGQAGRTDLNEDAVKASLRTQGYSDLRDFERDGDTYKAKGKRYGEDVDLEINAKTAEVKDPKRLNEDQVENMLEQRGYQDVKDVKRDGDSVKAKAKRQGKNLELEIDAQSGAIKSERQSSS